MLAAGACHELGSCFNTIESSEQLLLSGWHTGRFFGCMCAAKLASTFDRQGRELPVDPAVCRLA
jgi:hypothetical protein